MSDELIDKYFEKSLNEEEAKIFQKRLVEDAAFAKAFQVEKDVMEGLEAMGNQQLRTDLQNIYQEEIVKDKKIKTVTPPTKTRPIGQRRWWLMAATLAGLALLSWLLWPKALDTDQLYAQYAQHDFNFVEKGDSDQLLFQAEQALKNESYVTALPLLDQYLTSHPEAYAVQLAKGVAHLESNDFATANQQFKQIGKVNSLYKIESDWYLALVHLKEGNLVACAQQLAQIPEHSARYQGAVELLNSIGR